MQRFKITNIYLKILIIILIGSCSATEEDNPVSIREQINEYRREISNLNRKIVDLEKRLAELGEPIEATAGTRVIVDEIVPLNFDHYFTINGSVEAVREAIISPEINGQVKTIQVRKGQNVNAGQILVRLNTSVIENNIEEMKSNLDLANTIYERQKGLWKQKIGSEIQFLEAENNYKSLKSRLNSLESQMEMALLRSPLSGVIDEIFLKEGELALPGSPVMQIISLDSLYINADVSETYLPRVDRNDKVILRFPSYPEFEEHVPVHRIGNVINPENRTFRLQLKIVNRDERFKPNMVASLGIRSFSAEEAVVVPSILIKQDIQGYFVFVAGRGANGAWHSQKAYIRRGPDSEGRTMITDGLEPGDLLITRGHNQLAEGAAIMVENESDLNISN